MKGKNELMKKQKEKKIKSFTNNFYMLKLVWDITPGRVVCSFISRLLGFGTWVYYTVIFMKYLFGAAEMKRGFHEIAIFLVISLLVMLCISIFDSWMDKRYTPITDQLLHYHLNKKLFDKATSVDISCYETPEFYDDYTKATTEVYTRAVSVLINMATIISSLLASAYVVVSIFSINKIAALFTFLPFIGNFLFGKIINTIRFKLNTENIPFRRRQDYVNRAVYLQKYSKEIRLSNIYNTLTDIYDKAYQGVLTNIKKYSFKIFVLDFVKGILMCPVVFEGVWLYAAYCAMVTKTIKIGDFVVLASAIVSTTWMLESLSVSIVTSFENGLYIDNLKKFLSYKEKISEDQPGIVLYEPVKNIEFRNVTFQYDEQSEPTLKDLNFVLESGRKVALVGHNGAGKSTIMKLIMRLYDPTVGEILLNGVNIKEYNLKEYRKLIGTVFQDLQVLSMTVFENVLMKRIENEEERERALHALKLSGAYEKIKTLEHGGDTILTREFDDDGVVLSGGQNQKIAVARAFAKNSPIVLLDEPSSALDPVAEYQMYETIMKLCDTYDKKYGKISVIISHRLSSAAMADDIYLIENGSVLEHGNHKELMQKNGSYANMFIKQAESYLQEVS